MENVKPTHLEFLEVLEFFNYTVERALNLEFLPFGTSSVDIPNLKDLKLGIQLWHMRKMGMEDPWKPRLRPPRELVPGVFFFGTQKRIIES